MTCPPFDELIKFFYHPMTRKARTNKKRAINGPKETQQENLQVNLRS
jgi:hypothetical protein